MTQNSIKIESFVFMLKIKSGVWWIFWELYQSYHPPETKYLDVKD